MQQLSINAANLGSVDFRHAHGVRYAYAAGSMVHGIASEQFVMRMARAKLLSYFGTGGLKLDRIEKAIVAIAAEAGADGPVGMNLLSNPERPEQEERTVELFMARGVRRVEASAFTHVTRSLVLYRVSGIALDAKGQLQPPRLLQAKISRPEVAAQFLSPPPEKLLVRLVEEGRITATQAALARRLAMADDICVEADSGGHTDKQVASCVLPSILRLRDELMTQHRFARRVRVGLAGGLGTPEAVAAAFVLGAEFVLTGSINQCTVEAGTSDVVKDLLQRAEVQDTDMAPAGDMFEMGARVQVLKKGVFFPARANKLYEVFKQYPSLDAIDGETRAQLEGKILKKSFEDVYREVSAYIAQRSSEELQRIEKNPKLKMARVFQWYFAKTNRDTIAGLEAEKINFQIHCGPAMGACNRWLKGTRLEDWRQRHPDELADLLMRGAADVLAMRLREFTISPAPARVDVPNEARHVG